jgi:hypothetical protein
VLVCAYLSALVGNTSLQILHVAGIVFLSCTDCTWILREVDVERYLPQISHWTSVSAWIPRLRSRKWRVRCLRKKGRLKRYTLAASSIDR